MGHPARVGGSDSQCKVRKELKVAPFDGFRFHYYNSVLAYLIAANTTESNLFGKERCIFALSHYEKYLSLICKI